MKGIVVVVEKITTLDPQKAYEELKRTLYREGCKVINEQPPSSIVVEHGSRWLYFTPRSIEKRITFALYPIDSKTKITAMTSLTSGFELVYIITFILGIILGILFLYLTTVFKAPGALALTRLCWILAVTIFIVSALAVVALAYYNAKRDSFAKEVLGALP